MSRDDRFLLGTLFVIFAVAVGNTTGAAVAIPAIGREFDAGPGDVGWVVFGYSASFAVMTAIYGMLARRYGLARALVSGVTCVALGGLVAVVAVDLPMLITGRVMQGLGAGAFPPLSVALIARRLSGPARPRAIGINIAAVGVGFALGPLVGGLALETVGWRGAVALGILVAPAVPVLWRLEARFDQPDRAATLDGPGIALVSVLIASIIFLLNRGPILGLSTPTTVAAVLAVLSGLLLVARIRFHAGAVFPWSLVTSRRLWGLMFLGFVGQAAFLGALVLIPITAAEVHGLDGLVLGLLLVPMAALVAFLSPKNGRLQDRIGRPATTTFALGVISAGCLLLVVLGADAPAPVMAAGLLVGAAGFSFLNAPLANEVTLVFDGGQRSLALGIYNLAFFMGTASGISLSTAIIQAELQLPLLHDAHLPGYRTALVVISAAAFGTTLVRLARGLAGGWLARG